MLSNVDWTRLIEGLTDATARGRLRWTEDAFASSALGVALAFSRLISPRRLIAEVSSARYELVAAETGKPPFELRVLERDSSREWKEVGRVESSTHTYETSNYSVNRALEALYAAVDSTIEDGSAVVDRLLGGLNEDRGANPLPTDRGLPRSVGREPGDFNPMTQPF